MKKPTDTWEKNGCPQQKSIFDDKPKIFCGKSGCIKINGSIHFDHQPGCFWYGVRLLEVTLNDEDN